MLFKRLILDGREEFIVPNIKMRHLVAASIYGLAAFISGMPIAKCLGIFLVVCIAIYFHLGRSTLLRGAAVVVIATLMIWSDLIPKIPHWPDETWTAITSYGKRSCGDAI
jgi:hypothetical protein